MTNQEAIDRLLSLSSWWDKDSEQYQAIVMAISALQAQEAKTQLSREDTTFDLISRQAAIDAVFESAVGRQMLRGHRILIEILKHLPSAQPELSDAVYQLWKRAYEAGERSTQPEIIHCKDCKHFGVDRYKKLTWCSRINYGYGYQADDFCSKAERRTDDLQ